MAVFNADYLSLIGRSLNITERTALQCSLPILSNRYDAKAEFWGKVCGLKRDYLIAQIAPQGFFGPRVSFYSIDGGNTWTMLEEPSEPQAAFCETLLSVFMGNPKYEYRVRRDIPPDPTPEVALPATPAAGSQHTDDDDEDEEQDYEGSGSEDDERHARDTHAADTATAEAAAAARRRAKKPKFMIFAMAETARLSHFIQKHDAACRLVVRGQYVKRPSGQSVCNEGFAGQPLHHARQLKSYLRVSGDEDATTGRCAQRNAELYGPTYNVHTDFLSPITEDRPSGVWSIKYDATLNVVSVVNRLYEGSLFWYRPGTTEKGQVYCGCGEINRELCGML